MTSNTNNYITKSQKLQLIESLKSIPADLALVPVIGKAPKRSGWSDEPPLTHDSIISEINASKATGYGLRLGPVSGGIISVDVDGSGCHSKYEKIFGCLPNSEPTTVKITSGKPGRQAEFYRIPEIYWSEIKTKSFKSGIVGSDGKAENLEIHWQGKQQVLPPSKHPETKQYNFLPRCSFSDVEIAIAPIELIENILKKDDHPLLINSNIMPAVTDAISLSKIICKGSRDILNGSHEGSRNNNGAILARDLIGAEAAAKRLNIELSDTADQLFFDYCSRCTPPLSKRESNSIWKSALKDNPTASMSDDYILNCANAGKYKDELAVKRENKVNNHVMPAGNVLTISDQYSVNNPTATLSLKEQLQNLGDQDLAESDLDLKFIELAKAAKTTPAHIKEVFNKINEEAEKDTVEEKAEFDKYFKCTTKRLKNTNDFLRGDLKYIAEMCQGLGFYPEAGILTLYTAVASLLKPNTKLHLLDCTQFDVGPTIYSAIIAESGMKKTALQKAIMINPLREYQRELDSQWKQALLQWKQLPEDQQFAEDRPIRRFLYMTGNSTSEGIRELASSHIGAGICLVFDELSAMFNFLGKYSNGRGDDWQQIIAAYEGYIPLVARAGAKDTDFVVGTNEKVNLPIIGNIQPAIFKQIFLEKGVDDSDGGFARFMLVRQPLQAALIDEDKPFPIDLTQTLLDFFKKIDALPAETYTLSETAKKLFIDEVVNKAEKEKLNNHPAGIHNQYQKLAGKCGKFALLIHIINNIAIGQTPPAVIPAGPMKLAIKWCNYQNAQVKAFYGTLDKEGLSPLLVSILNKVSTDGTTPSQLTQQIRELKGVPIATIKKHLRTLASWEYIRIEEKANRLKAYKITQIDQVIDQVIETV